MSELERRLEALRREYVGALAETVVEARDAFSRVEAGDAGAVEALWHIAHKTYGTAGSYGLTGVSEAARTLELVLLPHRNDDALPTEVVDSAKGALDAFVAQADEAART
ncbi:MAG: Hpt domain-containing protein [Deltaproteobacteria bacterium]|nr:Hpt domain-containing protein [Deltaproteobacteria bacterium]